MKGNIDNRIAQAKEALNMLEEELLRDRRTPTKYCLGKGNVLVGAFGETYRVTKMLDNETFQIRREAL